MNTIQFFYIIYHQNSDRRYAGCKYAKGCHPSDLFTTYFTSSSTVHNLIKQDGVDSFIIEEIITEFGEFSCAYDYETNFLVTNDCAKSPHWLNRHNNMDAMMGTPEYVQAAKITNLFKRGVSNVSYCPLIKQQKIETSNKNWGTDNPMQSPLGRKEWIKTIRFKYNVDNVFQLDWVKDKIKETNKERYGFEYATQSPEIQLKTIITNRERRGYDYVLQDPEVKAKSVQTNLERRHVEYPTQCLEVIETMKRNNKEKYGEEWFSQTLEGREYARQSGVKVHQEMQILECPHCLTKMKSLNYSRWHGDNCKLHPNNLGRVRLVYNNGITHDTFWKDEQPEGWILGEVNTSKLNLKKITLYFLDCSIKVKLLSDDLQQYLDQGWSVNKTSDDIEYIKTLRSQRKLYNNGIINQLFIEGEQPSDFIRGGLPKKIDQLKLLSKKSVALFFLNCSTKVKLFSIDYDTYLSQGWSPFKTKDDKSFIKQIRDKKISTTIKEANKTKVKPPSNKLIKLYFLDKIIKIKLLDPLLQLYFDQGWTIYQIKGDKRYSLDRKHEKISNALIGRKRKITE
jgi:hypothetical protein